MIPKIIHCCWFGGSPKTDLAQRCIASWKRYCPDYEIREWNERNFDLDLNGYCRQAYDSQKWAFVSDVARIWALHRFGGIYMDTDVEVRRPLDPLLENEAFAGFESAEYVGTCLLGATAGHPLFREMLRRYASLSFLGEDGTPDLTTNVVRLTCLLTEKYGLLLPAETAAGKEGGGCCTDILTGLSARVLFAFRFRTTSDPSDPENLCNPLVLGIVDRNKRTSCPHGTPDMARDPVALESGFETEIENLEIRKSRGLRSSQSPAFLKNNPFRNDRKRLPK